MERLHATPASSPWQRASDYFRCKECSALTRVSVPRSHAVRVAAAQPRSPCGLAGPRGVLSRPRGTARTAPPACPGARAHGVLGSESRSRVGPASFLGCGVLVALWALCSHSLQGTRGPRVRAGPAMCHVPVSRWGQSFPQCLRGLVRVPRDFSIQCRGRGGWDRVDEAAGGVLQ